MTTPGVITGGQGNLAFFGKYEKARAFHSKYPNFPQVVPRLLSIGLNQLFFEAGFFVNIFTIGT